MRTLSISDGSNTGEVTVDISDGDLREIAIAFDSSGAALMQNVLYERLGYMPHPIFHSAVDQSPRAKRITDELGFVTAKGSFLFIAAVVKDVVAPTSGCHDCFVVVFG